MSLFSPEKPADINITLRFAVVDGESVIFEDDETPPQDVEVQKESFFFRVPRWGDTRKIMSAASSVREDGMVLDPYRFIDARIKYLLADWTLTNKKGNKAPISEQTIEELPPEVINYLHRKLDENPLVAKAFGNPTRQM